MKKDIIPVLFSIVVVTANGLIGHFFAPNGIFFTPLIIIITTLLLIVVDKNSIWKSILAYLSFAGNDILIRLFSGGIHDSEGNGWIALFNFIGALSASIILICFAFINKQEKVINKIISVVLFILLVVVHFYLFGWLGCDHC